MSLADYVDNIRVNVVSFGPKIEEMELAKIFTRRFRGKAAQKKNESIGHGIGLWLATLLLSDWGASLSVKQDSASHRIHRDKYQTTFTFTFPAAKKT